MWLLRLAAMDTPKHSTSGRFHWTSGGLHDEGGIVGKCGRCGRAVALYVFACCAVLGVSGCVASPDRIETYVASPAPAGQGQMCKKYRLAEAGGGYFWGRETKSCN